MRILIPSIQVPFIHGGSRLMTEGLCDALRKEGHEVEIVTIPFKFFPESDIHPLIDFWLSQDFGSFNGYVVDKIIALQFPAYYARCERKVIWLMHQHRAVYDIYDEKKASQELISLRRKIAGCDNQEFSRHRTLFTMSQNISDRLKKFNGIDSQPLYHPPYGENQFYYEEPYEYVFYPSRHEALKRQDLLIQAMKRTKTNAKALIAGVGGQTARYQKLIEDLGLQDRVRLVGQISEKEKCAFYARALAVFFGPCDEDYGYVTLEGMLSSKPVITCTDSGGPLEFITPFVNGLVVDPHPEPVAEAIDWLFTHRQKAKDMGRNGYETYKQKEISWKRVTAKLLEV